MSDRGEFEAWARDYMMADIERRDDGQYVMVWTDDLWEAWQVARRWRPIETYNPAEDPSIAMVCFDDGFVTAAEYSEKQEGGPDDFQTWECFLCGDPDTHAYHQRLMGYAWPTHWMPLPEPPNE